MGVTSLACGRQFFSGLVVLLIMAMLTACTGEPKNKPADQKTDLPPSANAGVDFQPLNIASFQLNGSVTPDAGIASVLWTQIDSSGTQTNIVDINSLQTQVNVMTLPTSLTQLRYRLIVTDQQNRSASDDVVVTLKPLLNVSAGNDQTVSSGTQVQLRATILSQGSAVSNYLWQQQSGDPITLSGDTTDTLVFTAPNVVVSSSYQFQLTVTDEDRNVSNDMVTVTVNPISVGNQPPTANAGVDQTVDSGAQVNLSGSGNDSDGTISAYLWSVLQGDVTLSGAANANASFVAPQVTVNTDVTLRLTVTDNQNATAFDDVVITIRANQPPTANAGEDRQAVSGEAVSVVGSGSDIDGTIASYLWEQIGTSSVSLNGQTTATVSFTAPTVSSATNISLRLTVTDNNGATASDIVNISVVPVVSNTPPTANAGSDQTVNAGQTVNLSGSGNDTDGSIASYLWTQISGSPTLSLSSTNTAATSFTAPSVTTQTSFTLRLTVTDNDGATGTDDVIITVSPSGNIPPTVTVGVDQTVNAGDTVTLSGSALDPDGTISSYLWTQTAGTPTVTITNADTITASFTAPSVVTQTSFTFELTATDNAGGTGSDQIIITINPGSGNTPPTANAGLDQTVTGGQIVNLNGSGIDTDGTIASYLWTQISGSPTVTLGDPTSAATSFVAPTVIAQTDFEFQLQVTDNQGATATDQILITVNPASGNTPPTANAGLNQTVTAGQTVNLSGSGADSDGSIAAYQWTQTSGSPAVTLSSPTTAATSFTAPAVASQTGFTFQLQVTDNEGATATDQVLITVNPATNVPPVADAGVNQTVQSGASVTLSGSGSDSDGSISAYQWVQLSNGAPMVALNNANTATATFTAPTVTARTEFSFELTVTDNNNATGTDQIIVAVLPQLQTSNLGGSISSAASHFVDGDVNDPDVPFVSNNTAATAQALPSPAVVGGYLNRIDSGPAGRSFALGDVDDHYAVTLNAGENINVHIGDSNGTTVSMGLFLISGGSVIASTPGSSGTMSLTTPASPAVGDYHILISIFSGSVSYVLTVGSTAVAGAQGIGAQVAPSTDSDFVPNELIVKIKPGPGALSVQSRLAAMGLGIKAGAADREMLVRLNPATQGLGPISTLKTLGISSPVAANAIVQMKQDTLLVMSALKNLPDIESVEPNYKVYSRLTPNDPLYSMQWHYPLINLPQAWDTTTGSANVIVAVLDTGILPNHPDLNGQLLNGYDFVSDTGNALDGDGIDPDPTDEGNGTTQASSFHGTHVAGTVAAASDNNLGVAGVAPGVRVMPLRVLGAQGGTEYDVRQALRYAARLSNDSGSIPPQAADIVNLSLGRPGNSTNPPQAFVDARQAGVIIIAAAGNDNSNALHVPSGYDGVVSVSAVDISRQRAPYSNFGSTVDIAAPGGAQGDVNSDGFPDFVLSTGGSDSSSQLQYIYPFKAGTSMAAPHVAGVVALMKSVFPGLTPDEFDLMLANGDLTLDLGNNGRDNVYGHGLVDAQKAVLAAQAQAGGGGSPLPPPQPALQVTPGNLNFGLALSDLNMTISNSGGGTLNVSSVSSNTNWLTVTPNTDVNNNLGSYTITVDRNGLGANNYSGTVTVVSDAGSTNVNVSMQVAITAFDDNAGPQIVELRNQANQSLSGSVKVDPVAGSYPYSFNGVAAGTYNIRSSSDLDNDGVLCEMGESCGAYPILDSPSSDVVVDGTGTDMLNLDFGTGFNITVTGQ